MFIVLFRSRAQRFKRQAEASERARNGDSPSGRSPLRIDNAKKVSNAELFSMADFKPTVVQRKL